jgi:hypothetical protein
LVSAVTGHERYQSLCEGENGKYGERYRGGKMERNIIFYASLVRDLKTLTTE